MLKSKNANKEYPINTGQKLTNEEETILLEELSKNIDIQLIAQQHGRTLGGINSRREEIAYKLHINNFSIKEISLKTKLDEVQITEMIKKRQNNPKKCKCETKIEKTFSTKCEYDEIKNDIKELKNTMKELVEMMKAIYEFEDA